MQPSVELDGIRIPRLGLGTWEVLGEECYEAVRHALDVGYRHVDTAQIYRNEEPVGRALADSDVDRDDVFVTTKVWFQHATADGVTSSTRESLERLGLDHVDLLLIHWPNDVAPLAETLGAMERLRDRGWTRLIGVSNFPSAELDEATGIADIATDQVEYHPLLGQEAVLRMARKHGLFVTAYSPLAHGRVLDNETLVEIGRAHGKSAAQVALRWLLDQDDVVTIPRSRTPAHIDANLDVFDFALTPDETARVDALPKDRRVIDPPFAPDWD